MEKAAAVWDDYISIPSLPSLKDVKSVAELSNGSLIFIKVYNI